MTTALFPGSFDPITRGHVDVIRRVLGLVDEVVVGVARNPDKPGLFSVEERCELIGRVLADEALDGATVDVVDGLTVAWARRRGARWIVRGVRGARDVDAEASLASTNRILEPEVDTLWLPAAPEHAFVASSLVRDAAQHGGDVSPLVPTAVAVALQSRFATRDATGSSPS